MWRIALFVALSTTTVSAVADWGVTGIRFHCSPTLGVFRFAAESAAPAELTVLAPEKARQDFLSSLEKENLFLEGKHQVNCELRGASVSAIVELFTPSERGECGADPGGILSLSVNGKEVLSVPFGNYCFSSAWEGSVAVPSMYDEPHVHGSLTVCGYGRFQSAEPLKPKCASQPLDSAEAFGLGELERLLDGS